MLKAERQTDTHNEKQPIFTDFEQEPKAPSQIFYQVPFLVRLTVPDKSLLTTTTIFMLFTHAPDL